MLGFYRVVAKLRAYLLRPVGSAAREKACWQWWEIPSRLARTKPARDGSQLFQYALFNGWRLTVVRFAEHNLIAHFLNSRSEGFDLFLVLSSGRLLSRNLLLLLGDLPFQLLHLPVLFQKLIEQHCVHCVVANGVYFAVFVAHY